MTATISVLSVMATLLIVLPSALAADCKCPFPIQKLPTAKSAIKFAVIGDWGRVGDAASTIPTSQGGTDNSGWCTEPANKFANPDAATGAKDQIRAAKAMEQVCKQVQCQFVINTGDSFYECGVDNATRWKTDFEDVYQGPDTPALAPLNWYGVFGNHDIVQNESVSAQINYHATNPRWFADHYYGREIHNKKGDVRLRFVAFDTNPFVTSYGKAGTKYNTPQWRSQASPENITTQLNFIDESLSSSHATWDIVVGHHPVFGAASANGYNSSLYVPGDSFDLGRPDASGNPSWVSLVDLMRKHTPVAYFNGHDHFLSSARDPVDEVAYPTRYVTSGAGSQPDTLCTQTARPNLRWSYLSLNRFINATNCEALNPPGFVGFQIVTATAQEFRTDYYIVNQFDKVELVYIDVAKRWKPAGKRPAGCAC